MAKLSNPEANNDMFSVSCQALCSGWLSDGKAAGILWKCLKPFLRDCLPVHLPFSVAVHHLSVRLSSRIRAVEWNLGSFWLHWTSVEWISQHLKGSGLFWKSALFAADENEQQCWSKDAVACWEHDPGYSAFMIHGAAASSRVALSGLKLTL